VLVQDTRQRVNVVAVHHICRRERTRCSGRVHAHVERAIEAVRKPAIPLVELVRRHPEVEEHTGNRSNREICHDVMEGVETGVSGDRSVTEGSEDGARSCERLEIPVETEELTVRPRCEQATGVAATTEGHIHQPSGGDLGEDVDDFLEHHRLVPELAGHRCQP